MRHERNGSERGMALPLALILLVALGLTATGAVFMSNTEQRISSNYSHGNNAITAAEAAAEHGIVRLSELSVAGQDPDSVKILADTINGFAYAVSVFSKREDDGQGGQDFNGDGDKTDVVLYDQSFGYAGALATGAPGDEGVPVKLVVAQAADRRGSASVRVEVAKERLRSKLEGPLSLGSASNTIVSGSFDVDGRLYDLNGDLVSSAVLNPPYGDTDESKNAAKGECDYWKAGVKIPAEGGLTLNGAIQAKGHVAFDHSGKDDENYDDEDSLATFKFTPEELLGVKPGGLDQFKMAASDLPDFTNLSGVNYITSGSIPSQISGSGILIVHNPNYDVKKYDCVNFASTCKIGYSLDPANQPLSLRINADGVFKGIIITDELIRLNGKFELLGGIVSLGTNPLSIPANGNGYARWSCEAVEHAVEEGSRYSIKLSWLHLMDQ